MILIGKRMLPAPFLYEQCNPKANRNASRVGEYGGCGDIAFFVLVDSIFAQAIQTQTEGWWSAILYGGRASPQHQQ